MCGVATISVKVSSTPKLPLSPGPLAAFGSCSHQKQFDFLPSAYTVTLFNFKPVICFEKQKNAVVYIYNQQWTLWFPMPLKQRPKQFKMAQEALHMGSPHPPASKVCLSPTAHSSPAMMGIWGAPGLIFTYKPQEWDPRGPSVMWTGIIKVIKQNLCPQKATEGINIYCPHVRLMLSLSYMITILILPFPFSDKETVHGEVR